MVNYTPKIARDSKGRPEKDPDNLVQVKELASKAFVLLNPDDPILDAQQKLLKQKLPGSPVINEEGNAVGFLSERDCLVRIMKMKYHNDMSVTVKDFMSPKCFTVEEDDNIMRAIEAFSDKSFNILPVVSSKKKVVSILTRQAVFRYVVTLKQQSW